MSDDLPVANQRFMRITGLIFISTSHHQQQQQLGSYITTCTTREISNTCYTPLDYFFLFFDHVCELLKDGTQLHDCLLYIFHCICSTLYVGILKQQYENITTAAALHNRWTSNKHTTITHCCVMTTHTWANKYSKGKKELSQCNEMAVHL